jgi:hypothetical protein
MYLCKLPLTTIQSYLSGSLFKFNPLDNYALITLNYPKLLLTMPKYDHSVRNHSYYGTLYRDLPECVSYLNPDTIECYDNFVQGVYQVLINRGIKIIGHYDYIEPDLLKIKADYKLGFIKTFLGGSDSPIGINKLHERTIHDYIHIIENQPFDCNGEYCVAIATMRLVAKYAIEMNYSTDVVYQVQQLVWSDVYLQAAYFNTFQAFPTTQKVVLESIPQLGY